MTPESLRGEVVELLQQLIRNACVNDGSPTSGYEVRNAEVLAGYLDIPGIELESFEPEPGRRSLVARLDRGSKASSAGASVGGAARSPAGPRPVGGPTLLLHGHTDVVPVEEAGWSRDPFGGELVDGWVWGRGAVDMLNLTASMAVAMRRIARERRHRPLDGNLVFLAAADEEALGTLGAGWLARRHPEVIAADGVITESGGVPIPTPAGLRLPVLVAEKGSNWCRITVRGTPGHGSRPYRSDNALVVAAELVRRLAEYRTPASIPPPWRLFVEGLELGEDLASALTDQARIDETLDKLPLPLGREAHAATRTTIAPTVCHSGAKANVIPGRAEIEVDIRVVPGESSTDVTRYMEDAMGDLANAVEISPIDDEEPTGSEADTPLFRSLRRVATTFYQGSDLVPMLSVGATDARFFRRLGIPSYGFGLFSRNMSLEHFGGMFHGNDERVDIESLDLSTQMWGALAHDFLG